MPNQEPTDDLLDPSPPSLADLNVDSYFKSCAETDPLHVEQAFIRLPSEFAYWAELQNRAFNTFSRAHLNMKRVAARLAVECREILEAQKGKATESMVGGAVTLHQDMQDAENEELAAECEMKRLQNYVDTMRMKKDALNNVSANLRKEMERDPGVAVQHAVRRGATQNG